MEQKNKNFNVRSLTLGALLTAIVVALQVLANMIQPVPGVSITLVLVPIIVGAAILGCFWGELMPGLLIGLGIGLFLYYYRKDR